MLSFSVGMQEVYAQKMNLEELTSRLNPNKELGRINMSGLAQQLGISRQTLGTKLDGKVPFTLSEAKKLSELLKLSPSEIVSIFF